MGIGTLGRSSTALPLQASAQYQNLRCLAVAFYDIGSPPMRAEASSDLSPPLRLQTLQRPQHGDGGPFAGRAVHRQGAAQKVDQLGTDVETESGAAFAAQGRGAAVGKEGLADLGDELRRHAVAGIGYREFQAPALHLALQQTPPQLDRAAAVRMLAGVGDKIVHDLDERARVGDDGRNAFGRGGDADLQILVPRDRRCW